MRSYINFFLKLHHQGLSKLFMVVFKIPVIFKKSTSIVVWVTIVRCLVVGELITQALRQIYVRFGCSQLILILIIYFFLCLCLYQVIAFKDIGPEISPVFAILLGEILLVFVSSFLLLFLRVRIQRAAILFTFMKLLAIRLKFIFFLFFYNVFIDANSLFNNRFVSLINTLSILMNIIMFFETPRAQIHIAQFRLFNLFCILNIFVSITKDLLWGKRWCLVGRIIILTIFPYIITIRILIKAIILI